MCFYYFFQKSLFTENYFLIAAINLATRGPLYTCLVLAGNLIQRHIQIFSSNQFFRGLSVPDPDRMVSGRITLLYLELFIKPLSYEFSILVYDCSKLNKVSVWGYEYIFWNCYRSLCIYFYKTSSPSMIRYFLWMRSKTGFFQDCFSNRLLLLGGQHKSKGCKTFFFSQSSVVRILPTRIGLP